MSKQISRRAAREQGFALLFTLSFHPNATAQELVAGAIDENNGVTALAIDVFAEQLVTRTIEHLDEIDAGIALRLKDWKMERISRVSLALLRLAVSELLYFDEIPTGVTINEAVELAKRYGDEDTPSFVNGILGTIARQMIEHS
ncbi:MAG: transcription antitermination factor NusB [Oscillospiraceae bacterium]|jgi:N utilization substance protein B|nr:transcription antitermination factor NusB [Oscillospiraceae bacterium]